MSSSDDSDTGSFMRMSFSFSLSESLFSDLLQLINDINSALIYPVSLAD